MPQDRDQVMSRKLSKQQQLQASLQIDFAARQSVNMIDQRMADTVRDRSRRCKRALHLYSREVGVSSALSDVIEQIDQLPFKQRETSISRTMSMLPSGQYDAVYSNLVFDWLNAGEFVRMQDYLLAPDGEFWLSCFGPSTAVKSRSILFEIDSCPHFNDFYELHDVGDALLGAGFKDVVLESTTINLDYDSVNAVMADAVSIFGVNAHPDRRRNITPSGVLKKFKLRLEQEIREHGKFTEQLEILVAYGKKSSLPGLSASIPVRQG